MFERNPKLPIKKGNYLLEKVKEKERDPSRKKRLKRLERKMQKVKKKPTKKKMLSF